MHHRHPTKNSLTYPQDAFSPETKTLSLASSTSLPPSVYCTMCLAANGGPCSQGSECLSGCCGSLSGTCQGMYCLGIETLRLSPIRALLLEPQLCAFIHCREVKMVNPLKTKTSPRQGDSGDENCKLAAVELGGWVRSAAKLERRHGSGFGTAEGGRNNDRG